MPAQNLALVHAVDFHWICKKIDLQMAIDEKSLQFYVWAPQMSAGNSLAIHSIVSQTINEQLLMVKLITKMYPTPKSNFLHQEAGLPQDNFVF